jgi:hypothetical protein
MLTGSNDLHILQTVSTSVANLQPLLGKQNSKSLFDDWMLWLQDYIGT